MYIALFILTICISPLYFGYKIYSLHTKFRRLSQNGIKTKGSITEFEIVKGRSNDTYYPIVQFKTYMGVEIQSKPIQGFDKIKHLELPKEVEIIYLDTNPKDFIIEGQKFNNFLFLFVAFSIVMSVLAYKFITEKNPEWMNEVRQLFKSL